MERVIKYTAITESVAAVVFIVCLYGSLALNPNGIIYTIARWIAFFCWYIVPCSFVFMTFGIMLYLWRMMMQLSQQSALLENPKQKSKFPMLFVVIAVAFFFLYVMVVYPMMYAGMSA